MSGAASRAFTSPFNEGTLFQRQKAVEWRHHTLGSRESFRTAKFSEILFLLVALVDCMKTLYLSFARRQAVIVHKLRRECLAQNMLTKVFDVVDICFGGLL